MPPKALNPREPRGRPPAGLSNLRAVAREQKLYSPNPTRITNLPKDVNGRSFTQLRLLGEDAGRTTAGLGKATTVNGELGLQSHDSIVHRAFDAHLFFGAQSNRADGRDANPHDSIAKERAENQRRLGLWGLLAVGGQHKHCHPYGMPNSSLCTTPGENAGRQVYRGMEVRASQAILAPKGRVGAPTSAWLIMWAMLSIRPPACRRLHTRGSLSAGSQPK